MAPMLGVVFKVASQNLPYVGALVLAYAAGHCSLIVVAGTFAGLVQGCLNWNERSRLPLLVRRTCGGLVAGLYFLWTSR